AISRALDEFFPGVHNEVGHSLRAIPDRVDDIPDDIPGIMNEVTEAEELNLSCLTMDIDDPMVVIRSDRSLLVLRQMPARQKFAKPLSFIAGRVGTFEACVQKRAHFLAIYLRGPAGVIHQSLIDIDLISRRVETTGRSPECFVGLEFDLG